MTHVTDQSTRPLDVGTGYAHCAVLARAHGTTYYWGSLLLPRDQRRHVHAIYALCRLADDIVDAPGAIEGNVAATSAALDRFQQQFARAMSGDPADDVFAAIARTVLECRIDRDCFERFFAAMATDLTVTRYETWADLRGYMDGSASVIGEMMLPVLKPASAKALAPARALGEAFQLTNFLRDVGEDLDRGRVYLPQEDLRRFGADAWTRRVDDAWRDLMRFQIARNRDLYRQAWQGQEWLPGPAGRCVATAHVLYARILERIERRDYDVFTGRARVPTAQKAGIALSTAVLGSPRRSPWLGRGALA